MSPKALTCARHGLTSVAHEWTPLIVGTNIDQNLDESLKGFSFTLNLPLKSPPLVSDRSEFSVSDWASLTITGPSLEPLRILSPFRHRPDTLTGKLEG